MASIHFFNLFNLFIFPCLLFFVLKKNGCLLFFFSNLNNNRGIRKSPGAPRSQTDLVSCEVVNIVFLNEFEMELPEYLDYAGRSLVVF